MMLFDEEFARMDYATDIAISREEGRKEGRKEGHRDVVKEGLK